VLRLGQALRVSLETIALEDPGVVVDLRDQIQNRVVHAQDHRRKRAPR